MCVSYLLFINEGYQVALFGVKGLSEEEMEGYPQGRKIQQLVFGEGDKMPRLFLGTWIGVDGWWVVGGG